MIVVDNRIQKTMEISGGNKGTIVLTLPPLPNIRPQGGVITRNRYVTTFSARNSRKLVPRENFYIYSISLTKRNAHAFDDPIISH